MAQKTKVKELVGRGLDSYHTKSLQQMDRIEKKNKEQNHKISILSNELDNDYLTKTEEGSVISLEHSKEGMVYLDELQGNTLVNYCTDGSKELTLNGDIDVEGTFVTTTEGVDNGKVDVMCEGNTLVNLSETKEKLNQTSPHYGDVYLCEIEKIKPNTTYTLSYDFECNISFPIERCYLGYAYGKSSMRVESSIKFNPIIGKNKLVFTIPSNEWENAKNNGDIYFLVRVFIDSNKLEKTYSSKNVLLLEGDWSNKEIPSHFEGMKSVGQDDENGHKIEILSQNKNLFRKEHIQTGNLSGGASDLGTEISHPAYFKRTDFIKIKQNTNYTVSMDANNFKLEKKMLYDKNKNCIASVGNTFDSGNACYLRVVFAKNDAIVESNDVLFQHNIQIEENSTNTSYIEGKINKKEILLNEPLRGLPNGIKDKFVKIANRWFIERNCSERVLDGIENTNFILSSYGLENTIVFETREYISETVPNKEIILTDRFKKFNSWTDFKTKDEMGCYIAGGTGYIYFRIPKTQLISQDKAGFVDWLKKNNTKILYSKNNPTYEPLEISPQFNTYNDVTHISNNSIIPCTMKVKNTGYNAIIKPSTLYTVALDTNKSGTIGINLGGAKGTTTNNVLTLTTPATLTDDSLRIYGKGIKGSKVRLLEGDKTNWIPSHFEGMKSCFEDKIQEDGSYKMEILSNNKNLLDEENIVAHANITSNNGVMTTINFTNEYGWFRLKLKNTYKLKAGTYYLQFKMRSDGYKGIINEIRFEDIADIKYLKYSERLTNPNCNSDYQIYEFKFVARKDLNINYLFIQGNTTSSKNLQLKDFILSRIETVSYESNKSNKIQFSSIEPLRSVEDTKDKFVFKDGKLMIERIYKQIIFDGSENWTYKENNDNGYIYGCDIPDLKTYGTNSINQGLTDKFGMRGHTNFCAFFGYFGGKNINIKLPYAMVSPNNESIKQWISENNIKVVYETEEPTYEEIPFELQKIILEGYENGTIFFDTNIPPTSTVTYAGEIPIVKSVKLNKTEVLNNTNDINDNIIPYLMDMDYRVVCLQLQSENINDGVSMARLFGGTYEMLQRDIQSKRYSMDEYRHRLDAYLDANKITEDEYNKLGDMLNE